MALKSKWATDDTDVPEPEVQDHRGKSRGTSRFEEKELQPKKVPANTKPTEKPTQQLATDSETIIPQRTGKLNLPKIKSKWASESDDEGEDEPKQSPVTFKGEIPLKNTKEKKKPAITGSALFKQNNNSADPIQIKETVDFGAKKKATKSFNKKPEVMNVKKHEENDDNEGDWEDVDQEEGEEWEDDEKGVEDEADGEEGEWEDETEETEERINWADEEVDWADEPVEEEEEEPFSPVALNKMSKGGQDFAARLGLLTPPSSAGKGHFKDQKSSALKDIKKSQLQKQKQKQREKEHIEMEKKQRAADKERVRRDRELERERFKNQRINDTGKDWNRNKVQQRSQCSRFADDNEEEDLIPRFNKPQSPSQSNPQPKWKGGPPPVEFPPSSPRRNHRDAMGHRNGPDNYNDKSRNPPAFRGDRRRDIDRDVKSIRNGIHNSSSGRRESGQQEVKDHEPEYRPVDFKQPTTEEIEKFKASISTKASWADEEDEWW